MSRLKGAPAAAVYDTEMDLALAASNLAQSSGDVDQIQVHQQLNIQPDLSGFPFGLTARSGA